MRWKIVASGGPSLCMLPRFLPTLLSFLFLLAFVSVVFVVVAKLSNYHYDYAEEVHHSEPYDIFILSSYYYEKSKSLGDASLAIVFTADFEVAQRFTSLKITASNSTNKITKNILIQKITPHEACKWISMFATTALLPNLQELHLSLGTTQSLVKPVVMCISPLFANEHWPNLLLALHVYKRFGAHMHLYIRSIVSPLLEMLEVYKKEGYLTIQSWPRIALLNVEPADFNPNLNVEFRSQAAAQTDCLLKYKETAEFVAFIDLDDILIPRLGKTYLEEFSRFSSLHPQAAYFHYTKENVQVQAHKQASQFSLKEMLKSTKFGGKSETGKIVARPKLVNSTWIHWPTGNLQSYEVPTTLNAIIHLKNIEMVSDFDLGSDKIPVYAPSIKVEREENLISRRDLQEIESDYRRIMWKKSLNIFLPYLPDKMIYHDIIDRCFHRTFYRFHYGGLQSIMPCPGPERCNLKNHKAKCWNSDANFHSTSAGKWFNVHFARELTFSLFDECKL